MADILPEKWMKVMAATTTALGVVASVAGSRASFYICKAQLMTAMEEDQWSYYDAKSIKQDIFAVQANVLKLERLGQTTPAQKELLEKTLQGSTANISHFDRDKAVIKAKADGLHQQNAVMSHKGAEFSLAVVFAQTAIMLSAVAVLLNRRRLWIMGLGVGVVSIFFMVRGLL